MEANTPSFTHKAAYCKDINCSCHTDLSHHRRVTGALFTNNDSIGTAAQCNEIRGLSWDLLVRRQAHA